MHNYNLAILWKLKLYYPVQTMAEFDMIWLERGIVQEKIEIYHSGVEMISKRNRKKKLEK